MDLPSSVSTTAVLSTISIVISTATAWYSFSYTSSDKRNDLYFTELEKFIDCRDSLLVVLTKITSCLETAEECRLFPPGEITMISKSFQDTYDGFVADGICFGEQLKDDRGKKTRPRDLIFVRTANIRIQLCLQRAERTLHSISAKLRE